MAALASDTQTSTICRITEGNLRWRVQVEAWGDRDRFHGRLVFRTDGTRVDAARESATLLHGHSVVDVLSLAHELPQDRLLRVLHSLG